MERAAVLLTLSDVINVHQQNKSLEGNLSLFPPSLFHPSPCDRVMLQPVTEHLADSITEAKHTFLFQSVRLSVSPNVSLFWTEFFVLALLKSFLCICNSLLLC